MAAGVHPPFQTARLGDEQGRVEDPAGYDSSGAASLVLGSDVPGRVGLFAVGDRYDVYQSDSPAAAAKILHFSGAWRGPSKMPALSGAVEPFALSDGQTLLVKVDEGSTQTITFSSGSFVSIGAATAAEVAAVINAQITGAEAEITGPGSVLIWPDSEGLRSRIEIVGGTAAALAMAELAWKAALLLDGDVVASRILRPGQDQNLRDMHGNLANYGDPVEVRFRLEVVEI